MSNVEGSSAVSGASPTQHMRAGSFFGAMQGKHEQCGAIFSDLRHTAPRMLPMHSHELAFFAAPVGEGIDEHVHRLRVHTPCERMLDPSASLAEVSFLTGFADQSHFTQSFRRITGMTPAAFRSVLLHPT